MTRSRESLGPRKQLRYGLLHWGLKVSVNVGVNACQLRTIYICDLVSECQRSTWLPRVSSSGSFMTASSRCWGLQPSQHYGARESLFMFVPIYLPHRHLELSLGLWGCPHKTAAELCRLSVKSQTKRKRRMGEGEGGRAGEGQVSTGTVEPLAVPEHCLFLTAGLMVTLQYGKGTHRKYFRS